MNLQYITISLPIYAPYGIMYFKMDKLLGGTPFWVDYWEDFKEILGDVQDLFRLLFDKTEKTPIVNFEDELSTALTDGIQMTVSL